MPIRRHLRTWTVLSLILQSAWLFALVPRDCCAAHIKPAESSCHEEPMALQCPMQAGDGTACPVHRTAAAHAATKDCAMRGRCSGPMAGLLSLLSAQAILSDSPSVFAKPSGLPHLDGTHEQVVTLFVPPDSPPPRV